MIEKLREIAAKRTKEKWFRWVDVVEDARGDSYVGHGPKRECRGDAGDDALFISTFANCAAEILDVLEAAEKVAADRKLTLGMTADECDLCDALEKLRKKVGGM